MNWLGAVVLILLAALFVSAALLLVHVLVALVFVAVLVLALSPFGQGFVRGLRRDR